MKTVVYGLASWFLTVGVAHAHSKLSASVPADGATLDTAPKELTLQFSEAVTLTALAVTKQGEKPQDIAPLPKKTSEGFALPAPLLATGAYIVNWRALSDDGHVMRGEIKFTVGLADAHAEHGQPLEHAAGHAEPSDHSEHHEHSEAH